MSDFPAAVAAGWHPVARHSELRSRPLARRLLGTPLAVFAGAKGPAVLVDRCPHRNMPLSGGALRDGAVECPYHGWRFAADGACLAVPGATSPAQATAQALPVRIAHGLVWTCVSPEPAPFAAPPLPTDEDGFWWTPPPSRARLFDAVENLLDPAHPHFLHRGLVRSEHRRRAVEVTVRIEEDRAQARYVENARAAALIPRLLEGVRTASVGRFLPPATGQLVFEGPAGPRLTITVFFTPEDQTRLRPFAYFSTPRGVAPAWMKQGLLRLFNAPVLAQDRAALAIQLDNIERFGGPRFAQGPLDLLGPAIQTLMAGQAPAPETRILDLLL
ncbi:MAG: hypothetical protein JWM33_2580 [Caulobacteraceae bacterium]|nr:hypothetical protein [Caulobacteraceae bacterium]